MNWWGRRTDIFIEEDFHHTNWCSESIRGSPETSCQTTPRTWCHSAISPRRPWRWTASRRSSPGGNRFVRKPDDFSSRPKPDGSWLQQQGRRDTRTGSSQRGSGSTSGEGLRGPTPARSSGCKETDGSAPALSSYNQDIRSGCRCGPGYGNAAVNRFDWQRTQRRSEPSSSTTRLWSLFCRQLDEVTIPAA